MPFLPVNANKSLNVLKENQFFYKVTNKQLEEIKAWSLKWLRIIYDNVIQVSTFYTNRTVLWYLMKWD